MQFTALQIAHIEGLFSLSMAATMKCSMAAASRAASRRAGKAQPRRAAARAAARSDKANAVAVEGPNAPVCLTPPANSSVLGIILGGGAVSGGRSRARARAAQRPAAARNAQLTAHILPLSRALQGLAPVPAHQEARQARRAAGRQLPPHRHPRLQLHQLAGARPCRQAACASRNLLVLCSTGQGGRPPRRGAVRALRRALPPTAPLQAPITPRVAKKSALGRLSARRAARAAGYDPVRSPPLLLKIRSP